MQMQTVGAYEAKTNLSALLDKVSEGESFTITRHGIPVAVLTQSARFAHVNVEQTIAAITEQRKEFAGAFNGVNIKELIEEGRIVRLLVLECHWF
jgi:prevent-host-death family protein